MTPFNRVLKMVSDALRPVVARAAKRPTADPLLQELLCEIQALRYEVAHLREIPARPMYEFPAKLPRSAVVTEKFTTTLPAAVLSAARRYAEFRGSIPLNVILGEALRAYVPAEHFSEVIRSKREEARTLLQSDAM